MERNTIPFRASSKVFASFSVRFGRTRSRRANEPRKMKREATLWNGMRIRIIVSGNEMR